MQINRAIEESLREASNNEEALFEAENPKSGSRNPRKEEVIDSEDDVPFKTDGVSTDCFHTNPGQHPYKIVLPEEEEEEEVPRQKKRVYNIEVNDGLVIFILF